jgi:hypothetical protein
VDYLLERFGVVLDIEAAFKAKSLVTAKVKARLEKVAVKEPEFAHLLAEVAERVLSSFGRLMASPDAARHVHEALFYFFEGYQTRDGEVLFARIERTVREAVRKAEEAGIPDAEYRIKQFVLEVIDILARAGERYRRQALEGVLTVEKALRMSAFAGLSAAALYSVYSGLYSEAVVSSVASAVALVEVGRFREAVEYVQRAAKALYEAAKEAFEKVKVTVQRLVELFVEAVARVLAWVDEHKAYLFLMAAVAAGAIALAVALNLWGLVEMKKLAYAASLTPFVAAGVKEYSREEAFNILKNNSDPYKKFKELARDANAGRVKLAEPWESLRMLIMPRPSEEKRLMMGKTYRELNEEKKKALFYAAFALEKAYGVYRTALRKYAEGLREAVQKRKVGEEPFEKVVYVADLGQIKQLVKEEEEAFGDALRILREKLNEYAHRYGVGDLNVEESKARGLAEAEQAELSKFTDVNFGTKAYAALIAYREYALGRRSAFGTAAEHWLEMGGSAWLLYYTPNTAYDKAKKARAERLAAVEEMVAEGLRRLFLKPGADHYRGLVELLGSDKLALELEGKETKEKTESYVFRLFRVEEDGGLRKLGVNLRISKVGVSITYALGFGAERGRELFRQELEAGVKAVEKVKGRLPVDDRFPYMLSWVDSDVAISGGRLVMTTSYLWQLAETHALFDWTYIAVRGVGLTLEGPKPQFYAHTSHEKLNETIRGSAEGGWLKTLGVETKSWDGLKQWVADHWDEVINMVKRRLEGVEASSSFDSAGALEELKGLKSRLNDDKIAREVVAPALLLIQAERLGVNETTLRYLGAVISGAIDGDGHVSAAKGVIDLTSGKRADALLWAAALAAHGIKTKLEKAGSAFHVVASGDDAVKLARLYFLYGSPLLEGDDRFMNHKLAEAVKLGAEGLDIRWEGLRLTKSGVAADLIISEDSIAVKYNVYLREHDILLQFVSTDRSRVELAARLLKLAGIGAEVKRKGGRDEWYIEATTDVLAAGREELRKALAEVVRKAAENGWVEASKAEGWLEKLEKGRMLKEGWPKYLVGLSGSGALMVVFSSTDSGNIVQEAQRLRAMGLEEGRHFSVKMPEDDRDGYVYIRREGLAHAAFLSVYGKDEQQRSLAAEFVEYILQRAKEAGEDVRKKAEEVVEEGKARGSLKLEGFKKEVEVDGRKYVVNIISGGAEFDVGKTGKKLLRIRIAAEVGGARREYAITFGRYGSNNAVRGFADVSEETDAERLAAVVEALTGVKPKIRRRSDGTIEVVCGRAHLEGFRRFAELADAIEKWLEETGR